MSRLPIDERFAFPVTRFSDDSDYENLWLHCEDPQVAAVAQYLYVKVQFGAAGGYLEAILEEVSGALVLRLHVYGSPGSEDTQLVNYRLRRDEEALFRRILATAEPLPPIRRPYLV